MFFGSVLKCGVLGCSGDLVSMLNMGREVMGGLSQDTKWTYKVN